MPYKHGLCGTRLYRIRKYMLRRCNNPNCHSYQDYGARGIKVCQEWADKETGAEAFVTWALANGYRDDLSIDRVDTNGDYSPNNCRWADKATQARNTRAPKNRTGFPGVHVERSGRHNATITVNSKAIRIGTFDTPEQAAEAYRSAKQKYHGLAFP